MEWNWRKILAGVLGNQREPGAPTLDRRRRNRRQANVSVDLQWESTDGEWVTEPALIQDASEEGLAALSSRMIQVGQIIWVMRRSAPALKTVVRHCARGDETGWVLGLAVIVEERRRVDRSPAGGAGRVRWVSSDGASHECAADVRNFSDAGMQLALECEIESDTVVRVFGDRLECLGSVRYCTASADGYVIGVQFIVEPHAVPILGDEAWRQAGNREEPAPVATFHNAGSRSIRK